MDDEIQEAGLAEQGQQGAAEGQLYQPQVMQQLAQLAADRRARMQQQPGMGMQGGVGGMQAPWTQASDQRLQRLSNGLSTIQQQVDSGELAPHEGQAFQQQIQGAMAPLMAQKQQATQQGEHEAVMKALKQSAMGTMIGMKNMELLTQAYPKIGVARDTDPQTGQTVMYHHDGTGKMVQTDLRKAELPSQKAAEDFPGQHGDYSLVRPPWPVERTPIIGRGGVTGYRETPSFETQEGTYTPPPPEEFTGAAGDQEATTPPPAPSAGTHAAAPTQAPPQQSASPPLPAPPDRRHRMTIQNGEHVQQFAFNPNGTTEKVADNHPDWTEIGHSGHQEGEVDLAMKQAAGALASQGYTMPRVNFRAPPGVVAQQIRAYDAHMGRLVSVAQNILNNKHKFDIMGKQFENREQLMNESQQNKLDLEGTKQGNRFDIMDRKQKYLHSSTAHWLGEARKNLGQGAKPTDIDAEAQRLQKLYEPELQGNIAAPTQPATAAQSVMNGAQSGFINNYLK